MAVSAFAGLMVMLVVGLLPYFLAGLAVLLVGWRARGRWSGPTCAKCGYDLRSTLPELSPSCPECGAALTAHPKAVRYARGTKHWGLITLALVIWLGPLLLYGGVFAVGMFMSRRTMASSPAQLGQMSNTALLQRFNTQYRDWQAWQEMEKRVNARRFSNAEIEQALQLIIAEQTRQPNQGLHWQMPFLSAALAKHRIADTTRIALSNAVYGDPQINFNQRYRASDRQISFGVRFGDGRSEPIVGLTRISTLKAVRVDGKPVAWTIQSSGSDSAWIQLKDVPAAGQHQLEADVESAVLGMSADQTAAVLQRSIHTATQTLEVHPADAVLVKLRSDASRDPVRTAGFAVAAVAVTPQSGRNPRQTVQVQFSFIDNKPVSLSCDVALRRGDWSVPLGVYVYRQTQNSRSGNRSHNFTAKDLPADLTKADLVLTPNVKHVESQRDVDEIWGAAIEFKNVPVLRYDLAEAGAAQK